MTARVRPARYDDAEAVVALLHGKMSRKIPLERWRRLFDYPWRPADAPDFGRVLDDGGKIVGYLGATYADRDLAGHSYRVCNLSSWYFDKAYRGRGLGRAMMADLTADPAHIYTDLTATAPVERMLLDHLGFYVLDAERAVFRRRGTAPPPEEPPRAVSPEQRRLIDDHAGLGVRALQVHGCLLLIQVKRKGADIDYHDVLYASDPDRLAAHAQAIADALLPERPAVLAVDRRLLLSLPATAEIEPIPQPRLAKGEVSPAALDNLYNEILLLDLKFA